MESEQSGGLFCAGVLIGSSQLSEAFLICSFDRNGINEYGTDEFFIICPLIQNKQSHFIRRQPHLRMRLTP